MPSAKHSPKKPNNRNGSNGNRRKKNGRLNASAIERAIGAFIAGGSTEAAARAAGVNADAIYKLKLRDPIFKKRCAESVVSADDHVEQNLIAMSKHHPVAAIFYLKNRRPDKWRDRYDGRIVHEHVTYTAQFGEDGVVLHDEKVH